MYFFGGSRDGLAFQRAAQPHAIYQAMFSFKLEQEKILLQSWIHVFNSKEL